MSELPAAVEAWAGLRRYTEARVALGRVGASLPTAEVLNFSMAHARAKDAVHLALRTDLLAHSLETAGFRTVEIRSEVKDRAEYLRRPDLGRRLHAEDRELLRTQEAVPENRLTVIVADGLSSLASMRHALPVLTALRDRLTTWSLDTVILATQARVALSDEIGALRRAEAAVILLGERPGLSAPDSLGIYLTYRPQPGRSDAERNCISNVRGGGLSYAEAAYKLAFLLEQSRLAGKSGVSIKDNSTWEATQENLP